MSHEKCPNNIMLSCPALMWDGGRGITDYRSRYEQNKPSNFRGAPKNMSSYEYAEFLRDNGAAIQDAERKRIFTQNSCGPKMCRDNLPPPKTTLNCDERQCRLETTDPNGFGMKVDTRNNLYSNESDSYVGHPVKECIDPAFYPLDGAIEDEYPRLAASGGGVPLHPHFLTPNRK